MNIVSHDWLEVDWHPATLTTAGQMVRGRFILVTYTMDGDAYTFRGIFQLEPPALLRI
jgi:hypothetical protein